MKFLSDSFEYCSVIIRDLSEQQLAASHNSPDGHLPGRDVLLAMYVHVAHHRGQAEIYSPRQRHQAPCLQDLIAVDISVAAGRTSGRNFAALRALYCVGTRHFLCRGHRFDVDIRPHHPHRFLNPDYSVFDCGRVALSEDKLSFGREGDKVRSWAGRRQAGSHPWVGSWRKVR